MAGRWLDLHRADAVTRALGMLNSTAPWRAARKRDAEAAPAPRGMCGPKAPWGAKGGKVEAADGLPGLAGGSVSGR